MRVRTGVAIVCVANALDLASSLSLHGADQVTPLPAKPAWLLGAQLLLLPGAVYALSRLLPVVRGMLASLPAPAWAKVLLALVLPVQALHVFFRTEHYPFSAVTMFSDYVPAPGPPLLRVATFVVDGEHGPEPLSLLREGNPYFARYLGYDYKAGWVLGTFGHDDASTAHNVARILARAGAPNPRAATVELDIRNGHVRVLEDQAAR
jgi:hypothetical protein